MPEKNPVLIGMTVKIQITVILHLFFLYLSIKFLVYRDQGFGDRRSDHNYCRKDASSGQPWCVTIGAFGKVSYEYCDKDSEL